jgi:hypothetical protein
MLKKDVLNSYHNSQSPSKYTTTINNMTLMKTIMFFFGILHSCVLNLQTIITLPLIFMIMTILQGFFYSECYHITATVLPMTKHVILPTMVLASIYCFL